MAQAKQRDLRVDLVKSIACLIVVLLHVQTPLVYDKGALTVTHLVFSCLCADGVMIFFAATGFFIFREKNFLKRWKKALIQIYLPGVLTLAFYFFGQRWLTGEMSFIGSVKSVSAEDAKQLVFSLLHWEVPAYSGHLWYLVEYLKCLLVYPLLMYVCTEDKTASQVRHLLIGLGFAYLLILDLGMLDISPFKHIAPYRIVSTPAMMMLIGYELYVFRGERESAGKSGLPVFLAGLLLFLLPNLARAYMQYRLHLLQPEHRYFLNWETAGSVAAASGVILMAFSCRMRQVHTFIARVMGPCTYGIYLIHVCVVNRMDCFGLRDRLISLLRAYESPFGYVVYVLITGAAVSAFCCLIILGWKKLLSLVP